MSADEKFYEVTEKVYQYLNDNENWSSVHGCAAALDLPEMEVLKALEELCIKGRVKRSCIPLDRSPELGNSVFYGSSEQ